MLPSTSTCATTPERRLADLFAALGDADRHALLAFAEFLAAGGARACAPADPGATHLAAPTDPSDLATDAAPAAPTPLPRPAQERVIAAIRRLGQGYPMLERDAMLHETAALMSQHVLQGRAAAAVIDDLEALFERHYQDYCRQNDRRGLAGAGTGTDDTPRGGSGQDSNG